MKNKKTSNTQTASPRDNALRKMMKGFRTPSCSSESVMDIQESPDSPPASETGSTSPQLQTRVSVNRDNPSAASPPLIPIERYNTICQHNDKLLKEIHSLREEITTLRELAGVGQDQTWSDVPQNVRKKRQANSPPQHSAPLKLPATTPKIIDPKTKSCPKPESTSTSVPLPPTVTQNTPLISNAPTVDPKPLFKVPPIYVRIADIGSPINFPKILKAQCPDIEIYPAGDKLRISTSTQDHYNSIREYLITKQIPHFTWRPSWAVKNLQYVIRGLPIGINTVELSNILTEEGVTTLSVYNIKCNRAGPNYGNPFPLYQVTLAEDNAGDLLKIARIGEYTVAIEPFKRPRGPPQCFRCQNFGHTRAYCTLPPVCVKCAGNHDSKECSKSPETLATCSNCKDSHTANYRGCPVFKRKLKPAPTPQAIEGLYSSAIAGPQPTPTPLSQPTRVLLPRPIGLKNPQPQPTVTQKSPPSPPSEAPDFNTILNNLESLKEQGLLGLLQQIANSVYACPTKSHKEILTEMLNTLP